jgi:hypothetical protein
MFKAINVILQQFCHIWYNYTQLESAWKRMQLDAGYRGSRIETKSLQTHCHRHTLISRWWDIGLVWTPSHLETDGNERADQLAKKGSAANTPEFNDHHTSKAWLHRRAREYLMSRWKTEIGMTSATWKYPLEWENWSFRDSKAIFGIYCDRTEVDPRPNND